MNYETQSPPIENKGNGTWKVFRLQLLILAIYTIILSTLCVILRSDGFIVLDAIALLIQLVVILIFMIIRFSTGKSGEALGYLASLFSCALIGFISCWIIGIVLYVAK